MPSTDYSRLDYRRWTPLQRVLQRIFRLLARLTLRVHVEGLERFPRTGPLIVAPNHIHLFDVPLLFCYLPRRTVVFVADKWKRVPVANWLLGRVGNGIWVRRGAPDRRALRAALQVLRRGGVLGVAPEGTRSRTGGLQPGRPGIAYLATQAPAPILPVALFGQEKAVACWQRLRRPEVHVRFGEPIHLPPGRHRTEELEAYTQEVMLALARLLPPEYRGVYADKVTSCPAQADRAGLMDRRGTG